jgi:8-oxo-dGTP diphosphatase
VEAFAPSAVRDVYVFVWRGSELLLLYRSATGYRDGHWGPPAGKVEPAETYEAAAVRELAEEVGLTVDPPDLEFVHLLDRVTAEGEHWIGAFFAVRDGTVAAENREPEKHSDMRWFDVRSLPDDTVDYIRQVVARSMSESRYSTWFESEI